MIEAINLTKKYGTHTAVSNLSFRAERGRVLGFLGPNGAGKSTTMNMLTGYISATDGRVLVNGVDMFDDPEEAKKDIGYLPEIPPVYTDMTVTEYLRFVAELKSVPRSDADQMIRDIMDKTGITDVSGRLIKPLSKGYKQRVGLAAALIGYPEVFILDEPTVGLDPKQIIEIRELIRELSKEHTIILSSHILSEVSEICDEIMIINKGSLVAVGTPEELTARMKGEERLFIDIPDEYREERVGEVLDTLPDIERWDIVSRNNGMITYEIAERAQCDVRRDLFFAFAKAEIPIFRMDKPASSLEDIFLSVTDETTAASPAAADGEGAVER